MRQPPRPAPALRTVGLLLTCVGLLVVGGPLPAQAATAGWATFAPLSGSSKSYTTTMRQPAAGFPVADVRSTSVGGSAVGVQTSAFLAPTTPPGAAYGSSRNQTYLNLRPNGLSAAPPSVTTYTFARPTPATGWTFVLGDIDADQVTITATGTDDQPVATDDLGFRSVFNYCAPGTSPKPPCAPPNNDGLDLPTWIPSTSTLRGNAAADDTAGASGWFEPRVALTTLTFTYAQRSGSPVYQTWFSALKHDLTGTVTAPAAIREGLTVRLLAPDGTEVATTQTDASGGYSFSGYATYDDYRVALDRPDGYTSDGDLTKTADLSEADATVDFSLRAVVGASVGGGVTTSAGDPVPDATVTVTGPNAFSAPLVTDNDGRYVLDGVPAGDGYTATLTVPDGYTAQGSVTRTFDVPVGSERPITLADLVVAPVPLGTVSGTVTDDRSGDPLSTVEIRITGTGGFERVLRTDEDGGYVLDEVPAGTYTITVVPPDGGTVVGPRTRTATITAQGNTVGGRDFRIAFPVAPTPTPTPSPSPSPSPSPTATATASPSPAAGAGSGRLAATGTSSAFAPLLGLGILVVAAGGVVILRGRRGRHL